MSENAQRVQLDWCGPYTISKADKRSESDLPPPARGIYMWVVGSPDHRIVTYVGQSKDIRKRTYEHVGKTLERLGESTASDPKTAKVARQKAASSERLGESTLCDRPSLKTFVIHAFRFAGYWKDICHFQV